MNGTIWCIRSLGQMAAVIEMSFLYWELDHCRTLLVAAGARIGLGEKKKERHINLLYMATIALCQLYWRTLFFDRIDRDTRTKAWPCLLPLGRTSRQLRLSGRDEQSTGNGRTEKSSDSSQISLFPIKIVQVERTFIEYWSYWTYLHKPISRPRPSRHKAYRQEGIYIFQSGIVWILN